jgi:hypothetical protein
MIPRHVSLLLGLLITASLPVLAQDAKPEFSYSGGNGPNPVRNASEAKSMI